MPANLSSDPSLQLSARKPRHVHGIARRLRTLVCVCLASTVSLLAGVTHGDTFVISGNAADQAIRDDGTTRYVGDHTIRNGKETIGIQSWRQWILSSSRGIPIAVCWSTTTTASPLVRLMAVPKPTTTAITRRRS